MSTDPNPRLRTSKTARLFNWIRSTGYAGKKAIAGALRRGQPIIEKLIYLGGVSERVAVKWLLRIYRSKFRLEWEFSKVPPHFYSHKMGMAQFGFDNVAYGPYSYYRGFYASQVIRDGDTLLDIGCGDGFFTKRFFSTKCADVDGIDIEPSAIRCARMENNAGNISYHLLDAVEMDFPRRAYEVIVWDGAIGHFSPDTLETILQKIVKALSPAGVFVGSETLGEEGGDHLTRFNSLDDFGSLFSKYFRFVEITSQEYKLPGGFNRREAYWRCANQPDRLHELIWKGYPKE